MIDLILLNFHKKAKKDSVLILTEIHGFTNNFIWQKNITQFFILFYYCVNRVHMKFKFLILIAKNERI